MVTSVENRNIVLAAIPRSGSTLSCHLLNQYDNCLAMIEPLDMAAFSALCDSTERIAFLADFFKQTRNQIRTSGKVPMMTLANGATNTFASSGLQGRSSSITGTRWEKPEQLISDDFTLIIKHPNAFSALIGELKSAFFCYALVRNPLAIIASWNTLDHPLRDGHAPMAEVFNTHLQLSLEETDSSMKRQLLLLDWYFRRFRQALKPDRILRYEDIIATGGAALSVISGAHTPVDIELTSHNQNGLYDDAQSINTALALLDDRDNACWHFYSRNEVEQLAKL